MSDQVGEVRALRATFASPEQMQEAIGKLAVSGFDRAELSVPSQPPEAEGTSLDAASKPAATPEDAQQMRTLGASTAATVAAIAAAGVTIATGGAAAPAIAAAVAAGGAAGGGVFALHGAADRSEQESREARAVDGTLVLSVHAPTDAKRAEAEAIRRAAGATGIETVV